LGGAREIAGGAAELRRGVEVRVAERVEHDRRDRTRERERASERPLRVVGLAAARLNRAAHGEGAVGAGIDVDRPRAAPEPGVDATVEPEAFAVFTAARAPLPLRGHVAGVAAS